MAKTSEIISLTQRQIQELRKKHYGIAGHHSAVQLCHWTKKAIKGEGVCYKQIFYGIPTHRCAEITPVVLWCNNNCIYCWRPMEFMRYYDIREDQVDPPEFIVEELIRQRKQLLSGYRASPKVNQKILEESMEPVHFAISLSGEPTMYPLLDKMIKYIREKYNPISIFLVTNGQVPEMLEKLRDEHALPTQLYISITAPDPILYKKISRPVHKDAWDRLLRSLKIMSTVPCRRVIRLTVIKDYNMADEHLKGYSELIKMANPDFVEVKAYMYLGMSTQRLKYENMPTHEEVKEYALKLLEYLPEFEYASEHPPSRIVLLRNKNHRVPLLLGRDSDYNL
ncbi:MAG: 4-demethylwyosine synthase TYW1 [Candidatus Asgardarchaeum sp.]|nr:4-demethylwyosine synthase TYW1 [Candidatus Odinarchaeota archaeon]